MRGTGDPAYDYCQAVPSMPKIPPAITPPTVALFIPGKPIGMPRPHAQLRGEHIHIYTPYRTAAKKDNGVKAFRAATKIVCALKRLVRPITGPVRMDRLYLFPRQGKKVWKRKPMPRYEHFIKPDFDNLDKLLCDSITQATYFDGVDADGQEIHTGCIWKDDAQIQCGYHEKWYCSGDEKPGTFVRIWALNE